MPRKQIPHQYDVTTTPAVPQAQLSPAMISLRELITDRARFDVSPTYQRQQVWPLRWGQQLVDSIFLGDNIGRFEGHEVYNEKGEAKWCVDEGHQRITTILAFHDGKFKTMTLAQKLQSEPGAVDAPVEPGRYFHELSTNARNYFFNYHIQIDRTRAMTEEQRLERFLRIQNHAPLTAGERLNIYNSKAKLFATRIEAHPFWKACYVGKNNRQQVYQSSLFLLALEMTEENFLNLQAGPAIKAVASGKRDQELSDKLVEAVLARLDVVKHVYHKTKLSERGAIVIMYQSVLFLEQAGYTVVPKDKGRLTPWLGTLLHNSKQIVGLPRYNQPLYRLLYETGQREFWSQHLPEVLRIFGLHLPTEGQSEPSPQTPYLEKLVRSLGIGKTKKQPA